MNELLVFEVYWMMFPPTANTPAVGKAAVLTTSKVKLAPPNGWDPIEVVKLGTGGCHERAFTVILVGL